VRYLLGLFALAAFGCHPAPQSLTEDAGAAPVDHIPKGDLAAGKEKAFALLVPYNMHVVRHFEHTFIAEGDPAVDVVSTYVQARVKDGRALEGPTGTRFEKVRVPEDPERILTITIDKSETGSTRLTVDDVTPMREEKLPPAPADRMKAAGLTPDGKIADPKRFE